MDLWPNLQTLSLCWDIGQLSKWHPDFIPRCQVDHPHCAALTTMRPLRQFLSCRVVDALHLNSILYQVQPPLEWYCWHQRHTDRLLTLHNHLRYSGEVVNNTIRILWVMYGADTSFDLTDDSLLMNVWHDLHEPALHDAVIELAAHAPNLEQVIWNPHPGRFKETVVEWKWNIDCKGGALENVSNSFTWTEYGCGLPAPPGVTVGEEQEAHLHMHSGNSWLYISSINTSVLDSFCYVLYMHVAMSYYDDIIGSSDYLNAWLLTMDQSHAFADELVRNYQDCVSLGIYSSSIFIIWVTVLIVVFSLS